LLNGAFLLGMAVIVLVMGYMRLQHPIDLPAAPMLAAAVGGLITEFIALRLLYSGQKGVLYIKGAFWMSSRPSSAFPRQHESGYLRAFLQHSGGKPGPRRRRRQRQHKGRQTRGLFEE
jgi:hypothetical protein